ncbi:group I truncated hemoglobin [Halomonas urumqiensis]|uniref:Group 1 truncated hemoglobin n=1 Tax=Halomonas urumqiensis TaxID=1684789 RepID=A0A2N7UKA3_9GAMM|nr:group 1 truncated hemoglobin [Halomonas urumqiensis]PMR80874.1 group 1 truncated hemoglobin [Halomonas urumqiensis]PTB02831.1 group 1 truncated hemoglobin [Halomonas urumqiensis]GHE21343.1 cyanoglobin [Halomonas urumqiensis]
MPSRHASTLPFLTTLLLIVMLPLWVGGCAQRQDTLYQQLGGEPGVAAIVEDFTLRLADDPDIVGFFANSNIDRFVASLEEQLCAISDGPCVYTGPPMDRAHQHMGLTDAHFNAVVAHMQQALIDQGVPSGPRNQLLGRLAQLHGEIMSLQ